MRRSEIFIRCEPFPWCKTEFAVSPSGIVDDDVPVTISVRSGGCVLHTYATRDEMRRLGEMLLRYANENEVLQVAA